MESRWCRRRWDEPRGDSFNSWGAATYFFETGEDGWPTRQVEVYDAGPTLRYGPGHEEDEFGRLSEAKLDDLEDWAPWLITSDDFEAAWCSRAASSPAVDDESGGAPELLRALRDASGEAVLTCIAALEHSPGEVHADWTETVPTADLLKIYRRRAQRARAIGLPMLGMQEAVDHLATTPHRKLRLVIVGGATAYPQCAIMIAPEEFSVVAALAVTGPEPT